MKRILVISIVAFTFSPVSPLPVAPSPLSAVMVMAQTTPGFNPNQSQGPASSGYQGPQSIGEVIGLIDSGVGVVQDFFDQTVGQVTGLVGRVFGLFDTVTAPFQQLYQDAQALAQLMTKLINFPSTVSGWWNGMIDGLTGQFDACLNAIEGAAVPPFQLEAGWCFGGGETATGSTSSPSLTDDFELLGHTNPQLAPPAGRKSVGEMVKAAQGPAGLPVPSLLRYQSQRAVDESGGDGDRFEVNPTVLKHYLGNRVERGVSRLQSENVLGQVGQAKMLEELKGVQQAVAGNFGTAGAAQRLSVTQDVMKQMVQMQASETLLLGSLAAGNQQVRVDNALTHLNLSNIGRSLDEQNRSRRIDRTLDAYKVLRSVSQATLF